MSVMVFFGGAMLTAAEDPLFPCELEYLRVGYDMYLRCSGACRDGGPCLVVSENLSGVMVYTCLCSGGNEAPCPGVAVHIGRDWFAGCIEEMRPCGTVRPGHCNTVTRYGTYLFYPACYCAVPRTI